MDEITLYDYQQEMKSRIEKAFSTHRSLMVQMPTGTGKTHLLASLVSSCLAQDSKAEVWIVAHRRELVEQIESTVSLWVDASLLDRVKVMSIQWLTRHYGEISDSPSLLVIDEAHHALAKTYSEVMNAYPLARKIGFTATPCRLQKQGFTNLFDELLQSWPSTASFPRVASRSMTISPSNPTAKIRSWWTVCRNVVPTATTR